MKEIHRPQTLTLTKTVFLLIKILLLLFRCSCYPFEQRTRRGLEGSHVELRSSTRHEDDDEEFVVQSGVYGVEAAAGPPWPRVHRSVSMGQAGARGLASAAPLARSSRTADHDTLSGK